jgi:hypothetical protein
MSALIAKMRAARQTWVPLGPGGRKVLIVRPPETEWKDFVSGNALEVETSHVCKYVIGWEGFTEATLLGETVGVQDPVAFSPELWAEYISDRLSEKKLVAEALLETMKNHKLSIAADAKNSQPSSTPAPAST